MNLCAPPPLKERQRQREYYGVQAPAITMPALEWRQQVATTAEAWKIYPATSPEFAGAPTAPSIETFETAFLSQYEHFDAAVDEYIDETYLDPIKAAPDNDELRTRLLKVYLVLDQTEKAIDMATTYLLDNRGNKATTYNHLGNAYMMMGDMKQAALNYQRSAELRPDDAGIQHNLERAMQALGRGPAAKSEQVAAAGSSSAKAAALDADVDSFYWVE